MTTVHSISIVSMLMRLNLLVSMVKTKLAARLGRKLSRVRASVLQFPLNRLFELTVTLVRTTP